MKKLNTLLGSAALLISSASGTLAMDGVVVSIKPIQSLVASVMARVADPEVIVSGAASPHAYSLKPSQARTLQKAKVVFWVGEGLETFLVKPLETLGENAKIVELADIASLKKLELREGGAFEGHGHDDHDKHDGDHDHSAKHHEEDEEHDKHEDHGKHDDHDHSAKHHEEHDDHDKHDGDHDHSAKHHKEDEGHDKHEDHDKHDDHDKHEEGDEHAAHHEGHEGFDPHIWLDPENAKIMVGEISKVLSDADPTNAETYASNAMKMVARLDEQADALATSLEAVREKPFVVFHDAYRYFEERYGLDAAGSITVNPDVAPGAARISELRKKLQELGAACVFSEPQFSSSIVDVLIEGTDAKSAVLDPLGASIESGPDLYFELMENMATSFKTCLSK